MSLGGQEDEGRANQVGTVCGDLSPPALARRYRRPPRPPGRRRPRNRAVCQVDGDHLGIEQVVAVRSHAGDPEGQRQLGQAGASTAPASFRLLTACAGVSPSLTAVHRLRAPASGTELGHRL